MSDWICNDFAANWVAYYGPEDRKRDPDAHIPNFETPMMALYKEQLKKQQEKQQTD